MPAPISFQLNQEIKVAVEARAMDLAISYFSELGLVGVEDVHGNQSFDLRCTIDETEWHVEVRGTAPTGECVLLTPLEVQHARTYLAVCLVVVSGIAVAEDEDGGVAATGGDPWLLDPWDIDDGRVLTPIGFTYTIPITGRQELPT